MHVLHNKKNDGHSDKQRLNTQKRALTQLGDEHGQPFPTVPKIIKIGHLRVKHVSWTSKNVFKANEIKECYQYNFG